MRIKRVDRRRLLGMLQHNVASVVAVARAGIDVPHDARHGREHAVGGLAATITRETLDIDPLVKLRAAAAHTTECARLGFARSRVLRVIGQRPAFGPCSVWRGPYDVHSLRRAECYDERAGRDEEATCSCEIHFARAIVRCNSTVVFFKFVTSTGSATSDTSANTKILPSANGAS